MDIEESGKQIGEKLFLLLNEEQKNALMQYILEQGVSHGTVFNSCHTSFAAKKNPLTEIQEGELYLCLEHRTVRVRERMINLTSKEFDILALLIANPKRVFTYELFLCKLLHLVSSASDRSDGPLYFLRIVPVLLAYLTHLLGACSHFLCRCRQL